MDDNFADGAVEERSSALRSLARLIVQRHLKKLNSCGQNNGRRWAVANQTGKRYGKPHGKRYGKRHGNPGETTT